MSKSQETIRNPPKQYASEVSLISYRSLEQCVDILIAKYSAEQIECATLISHDKDKSENHVHIYVRLPRARDLEQIRRWFRGVDVQGNLINTLAQPCKECYSKLVDYFLHKGKSDKYQYSESDLVFVGNAKYCAENSNDEALTIIQRLLYGDNLLDLVRDYGKDFVYHYKSYKELINDIHPDKYYLIKEKKINGICDV